MNEAISYYQKAVEANIKNEVAYCELIMISKQMQKDDEAISYFEKAVDLCLSAEAIYCMGRMLRSLDETHLQEVNKIVEKVLKRFEEHQ